ncbi:hypothetical protein AVEN_188077-1 [Araneus ventricosus]|uniref:Uncharacterized protein n=1 Tax=Araneus ventricosus TaxID=182803 RepID=A0A4Y2IE11_ARAVE|nr:hypothetical protein AVEN_188077-1 [Araneus ventricosus]
MILYFFPSGKRSGTRFIQKNLIYFNIGPVSEKSQIKISELTCSGGKSLQNRKVPDWKSNSIRYSPSVWAWCTLKFLAGVKRPPLPWGESLEKGDAGSGVI